MPSVTMVTRNNRRPQGTRYKMPICPKCETDYRDGFETCYECQVPLVDSIKRPESLDSVEEQFAEDMFDREDPGIRFCLSCFVEFAPEAKICVPCGEVRLHSSPQDVYDGILVRSPLEPHQDVELDEAVEGLTRVFVTHSPADAGFAVASLEGMGVVAHIGNDALDSFDDESRIGIWVVEEDVEACQMILPSDPNEWRDDEITEPNDPYIALVQTANSYVEIGRRNYAISLCTQAIEIDGERPDAFFTLGRIVGTQGHVAQAHESFRAAVERSAHGNAVPAAWFLVLFSFLDDDLKVNFKNPKADEALVILKSYSESHPRNMEALRLLLQACHARGEKANVASTRERINKINRRILEMDGPFKSMRFD
ncbi:MAG: hypothetical protein ACI97A_002154 [Planctomycetota bacterium]|jgi:hypothetical protein